MGPWWIKKFRIYSYNWILCSYLKLQSIRLFNEKYWKSAPIYSWLFNNMLIGVGAPTLPVVKNPWKFMTPPKLKYYNYSFSIWGWLVPGPFTSMDVKIWGFSHTLYKGVQINAYSWPPHPWTPSTEWRQYRYWKNPHNSTMFKGTAVMLKKKKKDTKPRVLSWVISPLHVKLIW